MFTRVMLSNLAHNRFVNKGLQSVLFVATQAIRAYWLEYERLIESLRLDVSMKQDDS